MNSQLHVHRAMGKPLLGGLVCSEIPLYAERYFLHVTERSVPPVEVMVLLTQFGGSRVDEVAGGELRATSMPLLSMLLPAGSATQWHYSGSIDFAVFYLPERKDGVFQLLQELCTDIQAPLPFSDGLVSAAARQLMDELTLGGEADQGFMTRLATVMLEQVVRALQVDASRGIYPPHIQLPRLHKVLAFIREHLAQELSISTLAAQAGVSPAHFRRLFQWSMGMPPHRYVMKVRLEHARGLLMQTDLPILHVALECGFSSQSHLTAAFKAAHATTPAAYRALAGGKGRP